MQQLFYDSACYHILYYDSELHAYRTDKFTGWTNQPPGHRHADLRLRLPGYMALIDAASVTPAPSVAAPTAAPSGSAAAPTPSPTGDGGTATASDSTPLILGGVGLVVVVVVVALVLVRRRGAGGPKEDE